MLTNGKMQAWSVRTVLMKSNMITPRAGYSGDGLSQVDGAAVKLRLSTIG
jgi:hypothetical protein